MKPPYNEERARAWGRMAPHIAQFNAICLCAVATFLLGAGAYGVLFDGVPYRRALPFLLMGLLFYFGAWAQLALVRLGQRLSRSQQAPPPPR
ncbi:hypothetical protein [Phenylobacterium sp.]|uniref:hypothetical protein n=1 Tax=Phenylobacterium sp. TaxID=1871053 RepID=UPI003D281C40